MIQIKPKWKEAGAEDLFAEYYCLLYKTLPLSPDKYLPKDDTGYYYYPEGDRSAARAYVTQPTAKRYKKATKDFCTKYDAVIRAITAGMTATTSSAAATLSGTSASATTYPDLETLVAAISRDLHTAIFATARGLSELLQAVPNAENVPHLDFPLNPEWESYAVANAIKYDDLEKELYGVLYREIFNYDYFSAQSGFGELVQMLNVDVCPYCNRSFTSTVRRMKRREKQPDGTTAVKSELRRHNQVDHYMPKDRYPWMALSLPNLIPVCANCNHKKSDSMELTLYPYEEGFGTHFHFRTVPVSGVGYLIGQAGSRSEFEVRIEENIAAVPTDRTAYDDYVKRAENSMDSFGLEELYRQSHNGFVENVFAQRYIFGEEYMQSLVDAFPDMFASVDDVRRMMYLRDIREEKHGEAPLSKLAHDIDEEIDELTRRKK